VLGRGESLGLQEASLARAMRAHAGDVCRCDEHADHGQCDDREDERNAAPIHN
jgi:hypothetical protein